MQRIDGFSDTGAHNGLKKESNAPRQGDKCPKAKETRRSPIILFLDKMVRKPFYRRINILHRLRRKKQYYTAFRGGLAAMPLISGIIKRSIRFIRNKYKRSPGRATELCLTSEIGIGGLIV
jgi:hypothetical protein